jgi:hypothetical protein
VNTFPFFGAIDRSMADNFFRPGFTQGAWANGEPVKGLNYLAFVGNGLNTLNISAAKIDTSLLASGASGGNRWGRTGNRANHATCTMITSPRGRPGSGGHGVYAIPGGPFFKSRSIQSREHVTVQL